ncbi:hypothetical protein [Spiroplasma endosymbiont of Stenodema calcarata]|uniref:hypothetical protein n=1 Tax=Spiroplasma endosymbiont of Stenodema calcarata TaxID=3139328 RepID=UPI003CCB067E
MFTFLVALGWVLIIIGALVQIFATILNLLVIQQVALPTILNSINDIFQTSIFKQEQILNRLTGDGWGYTIIALSIFVALVAIILVSFQINRLKKGQRIPKPYIKMIFVTLIIASLVYGKVAILIFAAFIFIGLLFIEASLFDVEALQNFAEERNMIVIYHQEKQLEREVSKEGKYHGSATMAVDGTTAGIEDTEKNFKDNDYVSVVGNKTTTQESNSIFSSNELKNLFNADKNDVNENELANLINDMSNTIDSSSNLEVKEANDLTKPPLPTNTANDSKTKVINVEESSVLAGINGTSEANKLENDDLSSSFKETEYNSYYAANANADFFMDQTVVLKKPNDLNEELNSSSIIDTSVLKEKEKKLYIKWNEMHQQALNIKTLIEEEVTQSNLPTKSIKKKTKIYNLIVKEANNLAEKLKLGPDQQLKIMYVTEIFGNNSQATINIINDASISTEHDETEPIILGTTITEPISQNSDPYNVIFNPVDYNIAKLGGELLPEIQSSDNQREETLPDVNEDHSYAFAELERLDDVTLNANDDLNLADDKIDNIDTMIIENNESPEPISETRELTNDNEILSDESEFSIGIDKTLLVDEAITSSNANIENSKREDFSTSTPLRNKSELNITALTDNKQDNTGGQILDDVVVSAPIKSSPSEIKPILDDGISYSLDELDNKIMQGDFSNLDDEEIRYDDEQEVAPVVAPPVAAKLESKQSLTSSQPKVDSNLECRFVKLEELIKNSIDLQSAHTKTLGEVQKHLNTLTLKVETLETKSTDFAKKNADVKVKKEVNYHGVVPIDQLYPQIDNLNLSSTRYNLYNQKGYSNTYGAASANDVPYGLGNYYRAKNPVAEQDKMIINNNHQVDYNHLNLHNISKYTKQDIPFETNCPFCKKNSK